MKTFLQHFIFWFFMGVLAAGLNGTFDIWTIALGNTFMALLLASVSTVLYFAAKELWSRKK